MKKAIFNLDLEAYKDAMKISFHDSEWYSMARNNKENIFEAIKNITGDYTDIAVNEYLSTKDVGVIMRYKKNSYLDEQSLNLFFKPEKTESIRHLIRVIENKTEFNGAVVKNLLQEYCDITRDIFDGVITPFPETTEDTVKPIKKFKITINENKFFIVQLQGRKLVCPQNMENLLGFNEYFENRAKAKNICRGYISSKEISEAQVKYAQQQLTFVKECSIPVNQVKKQTDDYKVIYKESQVFHTPANDFTIDGKKLIISFIDKVNK